MGTFDFAQLQQQTQKRFALPVTDIMGIDPFLDELDVVFSEADILIQQHEEGDRSLLACGAGCQDCCVVNVSITLLEGFSISRCLRQLDASELAQIVSRLDNLWCAVRGLEDDPLDFRREPKTSCSVGVEGGFSDP